MKGRRAPKPQFLLNNIIMYNTGVYIIGGELSCVDVLAERYGGHERRIFKSV